MKVSILLAHSDSVLPKYESADAAGVDLRAATVSKIDSGFFGMFPMYEYDTGLVMEIPKGYYGKLVPRSSISKGLRWLANSVGIIDADYRGTIRVRIRHIFGKDKYKVGDAMAQLILQKRYVFNWNATDITSDTERGEGGFGSTGS